MTLYENELHIGMWLDVWDENDWLQRGWVIGKIIEMSEGKIKCKYYGWDNDMGLQNYWINTDPVYVGTDIDKLHTHTTPIIQLDPIDIKQRITNCNPLLFHCPMSNKKYILILTQTTILKYDIVNHATLKLTDYPNESELTDYLQDCSTSMALDSEYFKILNIFDTLLVVIEKGGNRNIWFLDLFSTKWFQSQRKTPWVREADIIDERDNYLYFMNHKIVNKYLFKVNLLDIIPNELCMEYRINRYKYLIHGFIRKMEQNNQLSYNL
eukprot:458980_1